MEKTEISKQFILQEGVHFDDLENEYCSDRLLDKNEEEGGKPFSGLTYELYDNGEIAYYCYYLNGFPEGDFVEFYSEGAISTISNMKRGQATEIKEWYIDGSIKEEATYSCGICVTNKKWDKEGSLIYEKASPTEDEMTLIKKLSSIKYKE